MRRAVYDVLVIVKGESISPYICRYIEHLWNNSEKPSKCNCVQGGLDRRGRESYFKVFTLLYL